MKPTPVALVVLAGLMLAGGIVPAQDSSVRITYLYDNTTVAPGTKADWGFACLIQGHGRTILFDTGARPDILRDNMAALKVDPARVQALVFSHEHGDHTAGVGALSAIAGLPVYTGAHFRLPPPSDTALTGMGARRIAVTADRQVEVFPGFAVSPEMVTSGIHEEALVIDTASGSVVVVGCAHPGIVHMLRRIADTTKKPIHMVVGGFHLLQTPAADVQQIVAEFKSLGIARVGPTHCTGDEAMRLFREAYGDHFISGGVGTVVEAPRR